MSLSTPDGLSVSSELLPVRQDGLNLEGDETGGVPEEFSDNAFVAFAGLLGDVAGDVISRVNKLLD